MNNPVRLGEEERHDRTLQRIEVKAMREAAEAEMGRRGSAESTC
ncbi:hypothetical protein ACFSKW_50340 [Nonomuraea mangrovi]|uniref:Uncharacterized protein n=1 Tax=Nonomuraea mangrovi TaxID=2316207 RepID=A0ABW4TFF5_9ACTN